MVDHTMVGDGVTPGLTLAEVYRLTECLDGKIVYFAASTAHIHGVSRAVGHPEWCEDPRYDLAGFTEDPQNLLDYGQMTAEAFASMTVADALAGLLEGDVPSGPILERAEVLDDPQVLHNGSVVTWEHPEAGTVRQARPSARFSETPTEMRLSASVKGQDSDEVLRGIGRTDEEIAVLRSGGIVA
jgi:crotonobetainyl-CoA:carnitine CoA-transferase CaiB-like acyl-CoA transferase